jgi:hypothetical protein
LEPAKPRLVISNKKTHTVSCFEGIFFFGSSNPYSFGTGAFVVFTLNDLVTNGADGLQALLVCDETKTQMSRGYYLCLAVDCLPDELPWLSLQWLSNVKNDLVGAKTRGWWMCVLHFCMCVCVCVYASHHSAGKKSIRRPLLLLSEPRPM